MPAHNKLATRLRFAGRQYSVAEVAHEGAVWVPGRDPVKVAPVAVAMLYANDTKPYFIMGTAAFQQRALGTNDTDGFAKFSLGLALHELTHTRQLPQIMPAVKRLQSRYRFPEHLDDNVIQTAFERNEEFRGMHSEELKHFPGAVLAPDLDRAKAEAAEALKIVDQRRKRFFVGEYEGWAEMEDVFLALEGPAMWVQFQSALRTAPKGQSWMDTMATLAQRTDAWSQTEGLGLFLTIDRLSPGWQAKYFGAVVPSPFETLRQAVASSPRRAPGL